MSAKQAFAAAKLIHKGISSIKPEHIQQAVNVAQQVAGVLDPNLAEGLGEVSDVMNLHNEQVALVHGMAGVNIQHHQNVALAQQQHMAAVQQQQLAMAHHMNGSYAVGTLTIEQQQLAFAQQQQLAFQQQQLALAQQQQLAAAQQVNIGVVGVTALHHDHLALAHQQNIALAQSMLNVGTSGSLNVNIGMPSVSINTTTTTVPPPPPPAPVIETVIYANFPDGCVVAYDYKVNELFINGKIKANNGRMRMIPARPASAAPSPALMSDAPMVTTATERPTPVEKRGMMTKIGGSKTFFKDSWHARYFALNATRLSYAKDDKALPIDSIQLNAGIIVNVIDAYTPARRNRYKNLDVETMGDVALMGMGQLGETSGPIGKDHCVEMIVPGKSVSVVDAMVASKGVIALGVLDMKNQAQGRTYYMACETREEAEEWAEAIRTNVAAMARDPPPPKAPKRDPMLDAQDPLRSLEWYKRTLGSTLGNEMMFTVLSKFYDDLDKVGVLHG